MEFKPSTTRFFLLLNAFKHGSKNYLSPFNPAKAAYCDIEVGLEVD